MRKINTLLILTASALLMSLSACQVRGNTPKQSETSESEPVQESEDVSEESDVTPESEEEVSEIESEEESELPQESEEESEPIEESESEEYKLDLNVAAPSGAPAVALYNLYKDSHVEINSNANNVIAYLSAGSSKDIVIAPTNALSAVINKNAPFKIAATVTFGNFFIASTGNDDNSVLDKSDYVVLFQQNGLPDKLFKYVYGNDYTNLHYVNAASDANRCLITGVDQANNNAKVDYVLVPQPALTTGLSKNANASVYANVQDDYKTVAGGLELTQASIFVNNNATKASVDAFLDKISGDITTLLSSPSIIKDALNGLSDEESTLKFGTTATMLETVLTDNSLGLGYKSAFSNKDSITNFLSALGFYNEEISEDVFYQ